MPYRTPKPCYYPGCPELVRSGNYCERHKKGRSEESRSSTQRGYGYTWQKLRKMKLAANPVCEDPLGEHRKESRVVLADQVHHLIPKREVGDNSLDNLMSLCV